MLKDRGTKAVNRYKWYIILATILIVLLFGVTSLLRDKNTSENQLGSNEINRHKALLKLESGVTHEISDKDTILNFKETPVVITVDSVNARLAVSDEKTVSKKPKYHMIETPPGSEYMVVLDDGTKIWLNSDSRLFFPEVFSDSLRQVRVEGEVYINVANDEDRPFIVSFNDNTIKALTTEFNVRCYKDDDNEGTITVIEGSVELTSKQEKVTLTPEQQAVIRKNSAKVDITMVNPKVFVAWKNGKFVYHNTSLGPIMNDLARWYQVDVSYQDNQLKDLKFSLFTNRYNSIESMLEIIEATNKVKFDVKNENVVIKRTNRL